MPQTTNIVIADAIPANHTFIPQQAAMALSTWVAKDGTVYEGNSRLAMVMSPPSKARPTSRIKQNLYVPFERTNDGIVTVPDTIIFNVEAVIPSACSDAEALKAFTMQKNLFANVIIQAYFAGREAAW